MIKFIHAVVTSLGAFCAAILSAQHFVFGNTGWGFTFAVIACGILFAGIIQDER